MVGKSVHVSTNSAKPHRLYGWLHAETATLLKTKGASSTMYVTRVNSQGKNTMSLPCMSCQRALRTAGIKVVYYTDWSGNWNKLKLQT